MSYTNINIPSLFDKQWVQYEETAILNLRIKILSDRLSEVIKDLENIPKAINEYGYVDISYDNECVRLVKKDESK